MPSTRLQLRAAISIAASGSVPPPWVGTRSLDRSRPGGAHSPRVATRGPVHRPPRWRAAPAGAQCPAAAKAHAPWCPARKRVHRHPMPRSRTRSTDRRGCRHIRTPDCGSGPVPNPGRHTPTKLRRTASSTLRCRPVDKGERLRPGPKVLTPCRLPVARHCPSAPGRPRYEPEKPCTRAMSRRQTGPPTMTSPAARMRRIRSRMSGLPSQCSRTTAGSAFSSTW